MIHTYRRFAAFLLVLLLSICLIAVPAFATGDGTLEEPTIDDPGTIPPVDNPPTISFPEESVPPTPTPTPTPTPPPESSEVPVSSNPEDPVTSGIPTEDPGPVDSSLSEDPNAGIVDPTQPPTNYGPTPRPTNSPVQIEKPKIERPKVSLQTIPGNSPKPEETSSEPNYITFAQLNMKNNSLAVTLFYSGAAAIAAGIIGLVVLVVFIVRGRNIDDRDSIIEEIEEAENRQHYGEGVYGPGPNRQAPARPEARLPVSQAESPRSQGRPVRSPSQSGEPSVTAGRRSAANAPIVPIETSMYTDEFSLPEEAITPPPAPARRPAPAPASPEPKRAAPPQRAQQPIQPAVVNQQPVEPRRPAAVQRPAPVQPPTAVRQVVPQPRPAPSGQETPKQREISKPTQPAPAAPTPAVPATGSSAPRHKAVPTAPRHAAQRASSKQKAGPAQQPASPAPQQLPGQMSFLGEMPPPKASSKPVSFDTDEILREVLRPGGDN